MKCAAAMAMAAGGDVEGVFDSSAAVNEKEVEHAETKMEQDPQDRAQDAERAVAEISRARGRDKVDAAAKGQGRGASTGQNGGKGQGRGGGQGRRQTQP